MGLSATSVLAGLCPPRIRYKFAETVGAGMSRLFSDKRRAVEGNLAVINRWAGKNFKTTRVFQNFGVTLSDFLAHPPESLLVDGKENAERARAAGKGLLFLTSHLGNWELGGRVLSNWGWPVTAVYQPYRSPTMQKYIQNRRAPGLDYLAVGRGAAIGVARVLEKKGTVALLADRPFGELGEKVTLCGHPARLPRGPFLFAARSGSPIVPGFVLMEKPGVYRAVCEEPIWPEGKGHAAVKILLDKMALVLEKYLAQHADQWYCFESVWSSAASRES